MPALLDTHSFLWLASDEARLCPSALVYVRNLRNRLVLSVSSFWGERHRIKHQVGERPFTINRKRAIDSVDSPSPAC